MLKHIHVDRINVFDYDYDYRLEDSLGSTLLRFCFPYVTTDEEDDSEYDLWYNINVLYDMTDECSVKIGVSHIKDNLITIDDTWEYIDIDIPHDIVENCLRAIMETRLNDIAITKIPYKPVCENARDIPTIIADFYNSVMEYLDKREQEEDDSDA